MLSVAFSFCSHDRHMALELAHHIECLGGVERNDCIIFHPTDANTEGIREPLQNAFKSVEIIDYPPTLKGWPDGPNQCFQVACEAMTKYGNPWFWMEADCVPTTSQWLTILEAEYRICGQPILGVLNDSWGLDGEICGKHVTGVAVYPPNMLKFCPPIRSLMATTDQYRRTGNCPPAFDVYIAPYAVKNCAETTNIRHYWKSFDYRECPDGLVRCNFQSPYGASDIVSMSAPLIHGAKDFTLLNIIQRRLLSVDRIA